MSEPRDEDGNGNGPVHVELPVAPGVPPSPEGGESTSPPLSAHLRRLAGHSALYGAADVFTNVVNFLLVPLYTAFLTPTDYGTLALLLLFGTVAKIVFRLGLDAGFFRIHYDLDDEEDRRRLAGTVALFSALVGTSLFLGVVAGAPLLARLLLGSSSRTSQVLLLLAAGDVWAGTFAFVPLNLLRIQNRPGLFSTFAGGRHLLNTVLKVVLVAKGYGVAGALASDLVASAAFSLALLPVQLRHSRWCLSWRLLQPALHFGLPKVPHGIMVQVLNLADRRILDVFVSRAEVGLYQMAYTFGAGVKFAMSAFEPAWQPFLYAELRKKSAPQTVAAIVTWVFTVFAGAGLAMAVLGRELLTLMTSRPEFRAAAPVIPVVTLAYVLQGFFLLTSVGIGIEKKARYYPLITLAAAASNIGLNFAWIPAHGILGAAWATVASYAVMAGLGLFISQRLYPIPFEWSRLLRVTLAAAAVFLATAALAPEALWPAIAAKSALLLSFPVLLLVLGVGPRVARPWARR